MTRATAFLASALMAVSVSASGAGHLPALQGNAKAVSVSGISAGAFMATQLQIAFSSSLVGVGSIAGGPWNCSEGNSITAQTTCMFMTSQVEPRSLVNELKRVASKNQVDDLANLKNARVYLYNSPTDQVVRDPMNAKTKAFYSAFVDSANIKTETSIESAHGFPTLDYGNDCGTMAPPYMNNCKFDAAGELLKHIYNSRQLTRVKANRASLVKFDQREFGADDSIQMADAGYIYIPDACRAPRANCAVHVALHGCIQAIEQVQDTFAVHAGYNEWAEGSNIIVLYPQAKSGPGNPNACFDWFGYTGSDYATRNGVQMKAIKAMIDRVLGS